MNNFDFTAYRFDEEQAILTLIYTLDETICFEERIVFPTIVQALDVNRKQALDRAFKLLHLVAGVSYYKAKLPQNITLSSYAIDQATADLVSMIYQQGLAEFAYQNNLELPAISFPVELTQPEQANNLNLSRQSLVPIGGGKDSLLSIELLKSVAESFHLICVGNSALIKDTAKKTDKPLLQVQRKLDDQLFQLNEQGAYNGHVPVTAIISSILVCLAIMQNFDQIVMSNEQSANAENFVLENGKSVNHQWSKSFAFEQQFNDYVQRYIAKDLSYFSLLRPLSELAIIQKFAQYKHYHQYFSSCNQNFKLQSSNQAAIMQSSKWCGDCPKCQFVFLGLATVLSKHELIAIFGNNLLDDASQIEAYEQLCGYKNFKPFECVGTIEESKVALYSLSKGTEWRHSVVVDHFARHYFANSSVEDFAQLEQQVFNTNTPHLIPEDLQHVVL